MKKSNSQLFPKGLETVHSKTKKTFLSISIAVLTSLMITDLSFAKSPVITCESLVGPIVAPDGASSAEVTSALISPNGSFGENIENCVVQGIIDYEGNGNIIRFLMRLPNTTWNGNLFMGAQGGYAGNEFSDGSTFDNIVFRDSDTSETSALERGYAIVTTDTGHQGSGASWALDVPPSPGLDNELEINYGYRGIHLSAVAAKTVINEYYGIKPRYSYLNGCSNGGRAGLANATRYNDFDGIIVGNPTISLLGVSLSEANAQQALSNLDQQISDGQAALITAKVLEKCDLLDGVADNLISRPESCKFDPLKDLPICDHTIDDSCVSQQQALGLAQFYKAQNVPKLNRFEMSYLPGGENLEAYDPVGALLGFRGYIDIFNTVANGFSIVGLEPAYQYFWFDDPSFDYISFVRNTPLNEIAAIGSQLDFSAYDVPKASSLNNFRKNGGKMIMYHGWIDEIVPVKEVVNYYKTIPEKESFVKLYMIPGMSHCLFGPGPQNFRALDALVNWVENGVSPHGLDAVSLEFYLPFVGPERRSLLCPYPEVSEIVDPNGDIYDYNNYRCAAPGK